MHVCQVRTEVKFYKAINTESSLKFKAFSSDTDVIEQELVIEMLNKLVMPNQGHITLSKVPESYSIVSTFAFNIKLCFKNLPIACIHYFINVT